MNKDEALRLALEALDSVLANHKGAPVLPWIEARDAIKAALEVLQRTWVGLTDEEIWDTISRIGTSDSDVNPYAKLSDARAIEAKLREKNT
jgi:hypothetical protein